MILENEMFFNVEMPVLYQDHILHSSESMVTYPWNNQKLW